jgi:hypothetical protein
MIEAEPTHPCICVYLIQGVWSGYDRFPVCYEYRYAPLQLDFSMTLYSNFRPSSDQAGGPFGRWPETPPHQTGIRQYATEKNAKGAQN